MGGRVGSREGPGTLFSVGVPSGGGITPVNTAASPRAGSAGYSGRGVGMCIITGQYKLMGVIREQLGVTELRSEVFTGAACVHSNMPKML